MAQCEAEGRKHHAMDLYAGIFNSKMYASTNRGDRGSGVAAARCVDNNNWPRYEYSASPASRPSSSSQHLESSSSSRVEDRASACYNNSYSDRDAVPSLMLNSDAACPDSAKMGSSHTPSDVNPHGNGNSQSFVKISNQVMDGKLSSYQIEDKQSLSSSQNENMIRNHIIKPDVEEVLKDSPHPSNGRSLHSNGSPVTRNGRFSRADDDVVASSDQSPPGSDMVVSRRSISSSNHIARWETRFDASTIDNERMPILEKDSGELKDFRSARNQGRLIKSGEINPGLGLELPKTEKNPKVEELVHYDEVDETLKSSRGMVPRTSGEINSGWINNGSRLEGPNGSTVAKPGGIVSYSSAIGQKTGEQEANVKAHLNGFVSKDNSGRGNGFMGSVRVRGQALSDSSSSHGGSSNGGSPTAAEATKDGRISSFGNILISKGSPNSISSRSLGNIVGSGNSSPSPNKNSLNGSPVPQHRSGTSLGRKSGEVMSNRKSSELLFDDQIRGSAAHRIGPDGMGNIYFGGPGIGNLNKLSHDMDHLRGSATHRISIDGSPIKPNQLSNGNGSPLHNGSLLVGGANGKVMSYGGGNAKANGKQGETTQNTRSMDFNFLKWVQASNDPEDIKNAGNEYYKRGFFPEALILYDQAIALCPSNAAYKGNRAAALTGLGRLAEAVQECEESLQLDPQYVRAHQRAASLYLRLGLIEKANQHLHAAGQQIDLIELQRLQTVERHLLRCVEARRLGDWHNVVRESDAAVVAGADSAPEVFGYKCEALLRFNRPDEADNICSVAQRVELPLVNLGITPANPFLLIIRSQVDMALGRFEDAVGAAESAAKISPNNAQTAALLRKARAVSQARASGNELFKSGRYFEALASYAEGLENDPCNSVLLCNRAACRMKLEQWEKAVEDCDAALRLQPNYTKALMRRATCLTKLERWEDALQDYELLRREMPGDIDVARGLFDVQVAIKKSRGEEVYKMKFGGEVEEIANNEHYREAVTSPGLSVVQFITRWSDRCRQLSPFIDDLCKRHPCVNFLKVDVEDHPYIAKTESVTFIPTFKIYKNGQKVKEILGPSEQSLEYALQHYSL